MFLLPTTDDVTYFGAGNLVGNKKTFGGQRTDDVTYFGAGIWWATKRRLVGNELRKMDFLCWI
ncbi:MAG: hypothetical protein DRR19_26800 [Candidatus Parabeggiatoa sp. nov. 1]|nr:MAG: hypothetical protein DRR19_26800 [Gammaproteobacteria bacterium]